MTDLEKLKHQDELYLKLDQRRLIAFSFGLPLLVFGIYISRLAYEFGDILPAFAGLLLVILAIIPIGFCLKPLPQGAGLHINKDGFKMVDFGNLALELKWSEIERISLYNQSQASFTCFYLKNTNSPKLRIKSPLGFLNRKILGTPLYLNSARIKINRRHLYPLIEHFWEQNKN